jgi:peptidoglycan/LPS O-acetylase OafA/YrhL
MTTIVHPPFAKRLDQATTAEPLDDLCPSGHIPALDAVRGLAILAVTLYRFRPDDASATSAVLLPILNLGLRGVDLFFVLSGFLITGILYDTKHEPHFFRNFYARRALRIFPLYYGVLFIAFGLMPALWHSPAPLAEATEHQSWLWLYGANLLISWRGEWCLGSFDPFWSLAVEEHFYFVWPLVIYCCSRGTAIRVSAAVAVASAGGRVAWLLWGGNDAAAEVFTLFRLDALLVGAWIALVARGPKGMRKLSRLAKAVACASGLLLLPEVILQKRLLTIATSIYAVFFGALIILAITARPSTWAGRFWNSRLLRLLGKYSYGMYIFQKPLIPLLAVLFTAESLSGTFGSPLWGRLAYIGLMSSATLLVAMTSYHCYEQHFLKLKSRF